MATSTAIRNGKAPKFGVPSGKFLELSQKTNKIGPYEITDKLSVPAPTKKRNEAMRDAERRQLIGQAQLNIAYNLSNVPAPPMPERVPASPVTPVKGDDQAAKDAAAGRAQTEAAEKYGRELEQWKHEIEVWKANLDGAQSQINVLSESVRKAESDWDRAFLGPQHDDIVEFFDELDESLWNEFRNDLRSHWIPSQPDDGTCPTCGHIEDVDAAGKELKPSTG